MTDAKPGDLVFALFPNPDGPGVKDRTLLVVSTPGFTSLTGLAIVVGIFTERPRDAGRDAVPVKSRRGEVHGFVHTDWPLTIFASSIRRKVDDLDPATLSKVLHHLRRAIASPA